MALFAQLCFDVRRHLRAGNAIRQTHAKAHQAGQNSPLP